ncbi:hypothetical protein SERLA73DRAFT_71232 [Serpula lacrymans var. lacrymans S7.3]|uniref:Uncharacterized protein n=1 Tax=Serpula lacrymans var. lacrymans (strain S7.3) TaxID=936435 RepID=F8PPN0_SERL3|nr:hypothetical protein SERLA73DRAFT_71232 [Serpula lacrymans var. lacrymans S7.3]
MKAGETGKVAGVKKVEWTFLNEEKAQVYDSRGTSKSSVYSPVKDGDAYGGSSEHKIEEGKTVNDRTAKAAALRRSRTPARRSLIKKSSTKFATMIPFIPTVALAFVSFISSAFIVLRIVIPILPPHPLSRRVSPAEFGLPNYNFRSLSSADKSHLWLASLDILALGVFIWQAVTEYLGGPADFSEALDAASASRLWFALTIRQTCLLVVSTLTLLHIRMGRSVSFGAKHWILWAPTLLLAVTSTVMAGILADTGVTGLFVGLVAYSTTVALLSTVAFGGLIFTLIIIKRNLAALNDPADSWPPAKEVEDKPRPSFATEDVDAMREGSSWITSDASSRHESVSGWSFSTHHTHHRHGSVRVNAAAASQVSVAAKSSFWFNPPTPANGRDSGIPPVPPLPSPYKQSTSPTCALSDDPDPFRRDVPDNQRARLGSQTSWLTSPSASQVTLSAWSYPTGRGDASTPDLNAELLPSTAVSRPVTPALASAQVLGGYGYTRDAEKGIASLAVTGTEIDVSVYRDFQGLSLPYLFAVSPHGYAISSAMPIMLVLSVTISSPLLALNILLRSPIPIPSGLFDAHSEPPSIVMRAPSPATTLASYNREYKRSGSVTVVEGRRSGDVWISKGDAVHGKSKVGRAMGMLTPVPRLAVLPPEGEEPQDGEITPPLPMQTEDMSFGNTVPPTPQSTNSAELGRVRKESKASSHLSGGEDSLGFASRIMIAQRHYSALATTVVVPASPEKASDDGVEGTTTGVAIDQQVMAVRNSHLRSRSVSSEFSPSEFSPRAITTSEASLSPPPSLPLPPTPPNVRNAKLARLVHRKSYSSGFSFGAVVNDDINEIDALTAGVLPLLVPGLKVGDDMRIRHDWKFSPPISSTVTKKKAARTHHQQSSEFDFGILGTSGEFPSPQLHSTPAQRKQAARAKKISASKRHHFSLPSLGLGKDGVHSWIPELNRALDNKVGPYATVSNTDSARRNTVWGGESVPTLSHTKTVREDDALLCTIPEAPLARAASTRSLGLRADVPHDARSSAASLSDKHTIAPPSAASTVTLFELDNGSGPIAESTPQDSQKNQQLTTRHQPPVMHLPTSRRSSIVYIKPDENVQNNDPTPTNRTSSNVFAQWSSRAVRPLIPKASKLQRKQSSSEGKPGSPSGGLRPLSLLQNRDTNRTSDVANTSGTRPLVLGKKKQKVTVIADENADPSSENKHLKPLQLARSDTSKARGVLRKGEVIPNVVVRPPSTMTEQTGFTYGFR